MPITTQAQREALEKAKWSLISPPDLQGEEWMCGWGDGIVVMKVFHDGTFRLKALGADVDIRPCVQFSSILGLTPSLSDEERKALEWAIQYTSNAALCEGTASGCAKYQKRADALRNLLTRLGGGKSGE